jgi:hypothetical protein
LHTNITIQEQILPVFGFAVSDCNAPEETKSGINNAKVISQKCSLTASVLTLADKYAKKPYMLCNVN